MEIHGKVDFDVYANPIVSGNGSEVLYDWSAKFVNDGLEYTYSSVNGSGSLSTKSSSETVECLQPVDFQFDYLLSLLNTATPIPSASVGDEVVECASGNLFMTPVSGSQFAICSSGKAGFKVYSSDWTVEASYLAQRVPIPTPTRSENTVCDLIATPTSVTPIALALLTGTPVPTSTSRQLEAAAHMSIEASSCGCKSTPRPCIFLHGLGCPNERAELQDTPKLTKEKFGDVRGHAPCCSTIKYAVMNTIDVEWTNDTLQQKFCDFSLSMSETSDKETGSIADTIIVTHSMGGLVMASALANGKCKFEETTTWVSLSAPMLGSMAGDYIQEICRGDHTKIVSGLFNLLGQCPATISKKSVSYQNGKFSSPEKNAAYTAAQEAYRGNVSAAICSKSYHGVFSKFTPSCLVGGSVIPHKSKENDALVEFQSCLAGLDPELFGDSYQDRFYGAKLNHADTGFLTRDGLFSDSQKPFKWFECLL
ncbi:hypothetical protein DVH05_027314 [Phytophthora capsici]|nr:hypothetical protein DVH05_027314 [Phytophthora capsici]